MQEKTNLDEHDFIEQLKGAFPDLGCPADWLPTCTCLECLELAAYLRERPYWTRFTAKDCFWANTTSLMGKAFDYYLPAYIVASLTDPDTADVAVDYSSWRFLSYPPDCSPDRQRFLSFTSDQRLLILEWLEWYAEAHSVDEEQQGGYMQQIEILRRSAS